MDFVATVSITVLVITIGIIVFLAFKVSNLMKNTHSE